jgi:hypothetical protein
MRNKTRSESGFTVLVFLTLLLMLSLLGINAILTSTDEVDIAGYELNSTKSFYAAEAGLEKATADLTNYYDRHGRAPANLPSGTIQIGNYTIHYAISMPGTTEVRTLRTGAYEGLYGLSDRYVVKATATSPGVKAKTTLKASVDASVVPIYQFAVFYEGDLEIAPGPVMKIGGRAHSNKNMYLQSDDSLKIDSYTTAAGKIYHGRSPSAGLSVGYGNVLIKDHDGTYEGMQNRDGSWLDAHTADWVEQSVGRWGGQVEDNTHGITQLNLPVVSSTVPKDMIRRGGASNPDSYENKADLKIVNGQVLWRAVDSNWYDVTASFVSQGILAINTFYDGREGKDVTSWDVDLTKLGASGYWPRNGIMYSAAAINPFDATRLVNGQQLLSKLTVASENPVYTLGDYNTISKQPASIMTDAYTVLSNGWSDASSWSNLNHRPASDTRVYVAYMTGNKPSGSGGASSYSGGFENLPRLLEKWDGKTFTWVGAAVDLWESTKAVGYWNYGTYYTAPICNWSFDTDFLTMSKLPPGTPVIAVMQKTGWNESIAYGGH